MVKIVNIWIKSARASNVMTKKLLSKSKNEEDERSSSSTMKTSALKIPSTPILLTRETRSTLKKLFRCRKNKFSVKTPKEFSL